MLIIEQTLYDLGYHDSAKMLEEESGINYYTEELLSIRRHLEKNEFERAIGVIESLHDSNHQTNLVNNHNKTNGEHTQC